MLGVSSQLAWMAAYAPERECLVAASGRWTYAAFDAAVDRTASALAAAGTRPGDTLGVLMGNTAGHLRTYLGGHRRGCTVVPLNFKGGTEEIARQVAHDGVDTLVVSAEYRETLAAIRDDLDVGTVVVEGGPVADDDLDLEALLEDADDEPPAPGYLPTDHTACIYHTGGTTGVPKSVPWPAGRIEENARKTAMRLGLGAEDTQLVATPLFHIGSMMVGVGMALYVGGRIVLLPRFSPQPTLEAIEAEGATATLLVPSMMRALLASDALRSGAYDLSSLETIAFTGETLDTETHRAIGAAFPNADVWNVYGATEIGVTMTLPPGEDAEDNCVGLPFADREVSVRGADGAALDDGAYGEVWVRGRGLPSGFYRMPEETAEKYGNGPEGDWFRTGDVGYRDGAGRLHVVGRADDRIIRGGENIQPVEIENHLLALDGVEEAAVFGIDHAILGEAVAAAVVTSRDDVDEAALLAHCDGVLATYKHPEHVVFRDALPRTDAGKFDRQALRDEVGRSLEG